MPAYHGCQFPAGASRRKIMERDPELMPVLSRNFQKLYCFITTILGISSRGLISLLALEDLASLSGSMVWFPDGEHSSLEIIYCSGSLFFLILSLTFKLHCQHSHPLSTMLADSFQFICYLRRSLSRGNIARQRDGKKNPAEVITDVHCGQLAT